MHAWPGTLTIALHALDTYSVRAWNEGIGLNRKKKSKGIFSICNEVLTSSIKGYGQDDSMDQKGWY
jgi:hypothetical protein